MKKKINVAVCISGQMRSYKKCYNSLLNKIIVPLEADIFIHTWEKIGKSHKEKGKKINGKITKEELIDLYNADSLEIESQPSGSNEVFKNKKVPKELIKEEPLHYKSALPMYYQIYKSFKLLEKYSMKNNIRYDLVIRVRPDTMFKEKIPNYIIESALKDSEMVFFADYAIDTDFQVCDKFAIGGYKGMKKYFSLWENIEEYWKDPIGVNPPETHKVGERLMKYHVEESNIKARPFYLDIYNLRVNGKKVFYKKRNFYKRLLKKVKYFLKYKF